ncbi:ABC transporter substrate-binding protein [Liberiplasma polymorphum]|uniref:ABC transporter substrate-binding protein n=1 Tax=Liberiplasma polymorphum TaxID=3374570 RepID=UPI0037718F95
MKKLVLLIIAVVAAFTLAACGRRDTETLIIFQNKVEIDSALRTYAEAWAEEKGYKIEVKTCGGDACAYGDQLLAEFQTRNQPDIFVIEGMGGFNQFRDKLLVLDGQPWISDTDLSLTVDGEVYGFPVNIEGWGLAYNKDILDLAGVDPATLTNIAGYQAAFEAIDAQLTELGLDGVVSMAAGSGMTWVTGLHNFNGYLSSGLDYNDDSVISDLLNGVAHEDRLEALADWVELLFEYSIPTILTQGEYDSQVGAFAEGKAAFIHQGNWIDPNLLQIGIDFEVGYAPHASGLGDVDSIFIGAPSYYVVNRDGNNTEKALEFLADLAGTPEGHDYMVNQSNQVPAFQSVTLEPTAPLSAVIAQWNAEGKAYRWWQNDMPPGFGMDTLGPIYQQFASGTITREQFITRIKDAIEELG